MDDDKWKLDVAGQLGAINSQLKENGSKTGAMHDSLRCINHKLAGNGGPGIMTRLDRVENQCKECEFTKKRRIALFGSVIVAVVCLICREIWTHFTTEH